MFLGFSPAAPVDQVPFFIRATNQTERRVNPAHLTADHWWQIQQQYNYLR